MNRLWGNSLLVIVAAVFALPQTGAAQSSAQSLPRVVIVTNGDEAGHRPFREHFLNGMQRSGQTEGVTYRLEILYANRDSTRSAGLIQEAVAGRPAALVVYGLSSARVARDASQSVPVVVATSSDLVDAGIVRSYAHPGGNITGVSDLSDELTVKRLELIRNAMPNASRVALLLNPHFPATPKIERRVQEVARGIGIAILRVYAKDPQSLIAALDSLRGSRVDALLLGGDALFVVRAKELIEHANSIGVPVVHYWPGTAEMGALMSHQAQVYQNVELAADYVNRILKGANPGDLPVLQPTIYDFVINAKVAKRYGL
ncbi:MAG TPA: ABC transporter substrate-binding protein [Burkholderiaceae bacterium]|nr:ABC transporter substrate-binding protein [Burkholderiaceae bacterium]